MSTYENDSVFDQQYIRNKRQIRALRRENHEQAFYIKLMTVINVGLLAIITVCFFRIGGLLNNIESLSDQVVTLTVSNKQLLLENESLSIQFNACSDLLQDVSEIAVSLDDSNKELLNQNAGLNEVLSAYVEREELYNKYEYALVREDGSRTDITYDQVKSLQNHASEKGMTDESVDLVLSLAMTESNGVEKAKNPKSTASGYGQFLSTTGEFVYERLMGMDGYTHDMSMDGDLNLEMMIEYLCYLNIKYDKDMDLIINEYRGLDLPEYKAKVNSYLNYNDLSLQTMRLSN